MASLTLLEMTQNILSALSSDEVNSISDTTESMQVAEIIKTTYFNIAARAQLTGSKTLFQLDDSLDVTKPVLMTRPSDIDKMEWVQYFNADPETNMFKYVTILPPTQFLDYVNGFDLTADNVNTFAFNVNSETFNLAYKNDATPTFCTTFDNFYIIFDSYDASLDDTLHAFKTRCWGSVSEVFEMIDAFVPIIPENVFPLLLNEAKALAFFELKQASHPKAEQESRRQWNTLQKNKSLVDKPTYFDQLADFGRRGGGYMSNSSYFKSRGWDRS